MNENFSALTTEQVNSATAHIDSCTTLEDARLISDGNESIADLILIP